MLGAEKLQAYAERSLGRKCTKVSDRVYHFAGYGHSNSIAIIGDTSIILIDAQDCPAAAEEIRAELATLTDKPVKTILFTHGHPDHRGGSGAFRDTVEEVIAFSPVSKPLARSEKINDALMKRGTWQFGGGLSDEEALTQVLGPREGRYTGRGRYDFLAPTTVYHDDVLDLTIDGVSLHIVRTPGETDDGVSIWLADERALCCGDIFYACWPNLYAIRGSAYRDIATWVDSLSRIIAMEADILLPGHTQAIIGCDIVRDTLTTYRDAIDYVLNATLDCLNRGLTLQETVEAVELPAEYAEKPYLGQHYGTVEWSVKGIYTGYVGWFDGDPVKLLPSRSRKFANTLVDMLGTEAIVARAKEAHEIGDHQLALELLELADDPALRHDCLMSLALMQENGNARHYFLSAAKMLEK